MQVTLAQISPKLNRSNLETVLSIVDSHQAKSDLIVFPELALNGYMLQDKLYEDAWDISELNALAKLSKNVDICIGAALREKDVFKNTALYFSNGVLLSKHDKLHLPNYGMFEEARYFEAGNSLESFKTTFGKVSMLVCEDLWHDSMRQNLVKENPSLILALAASPARGFKDSGLEIEDSWHSIIKSIAKDSQATLIFVNRVGFEDGLGFWGGSCIVDAKANIINKLPHYKETIKTFEIKERDRISSYVNLNPKENIMKIAIMGAMPEEIAPILKKLGEYKTTKYADNEYYEATYNGVEVVVAYSKIGKVFSTLTASTMIQHFNCDRLLFSGVAGGINPNLKIGDLIVATKLSQHDLDITAFGHPMGFVPGGSVFVEADVALIALSKEVASELGKTIQEGIIATGDQFVHDSKIKDNIVKHFNADALEMEGASVAVVCKSLDVPFFILRAISDTADTDASFSFDEFMESSAIISAEFIMKMVDKIVR